MRLIDADAVKFNFQYGRDDNGILLVPYRDAKKMIEAAKTVDAVPVVRCKEFKWTGGDFVCYRGVMVQHKPEDFCSYGERRGCGEDD